MDNKDILLVLLAGLLILAAILTALFGGEHSRHGYRSRTTQGAIVTTG